MCRFVSVLAVVACLVFAGNARAVCAGERWPVKVATDVDASLIFGVAIPTNIAFLRGLPAQRPLPQERRVLPVETTMYIVTATLTEYRLEEDGDVHLVLANAAGETIVARIPATECVNGSQFALQIKAARLGFDARFVANPEAQRAMVPIEVRGVAFFDFRHGRPGEAPNGISLHPVTSINFRPLVPPTPPRYGRRRAVAPRRTICTVPSLTLSASKSSACPSEAVTLRWQASDPAAEVRIDGIGTALPASGSTSVVPNASSAYSGHASNACGAGYESVAVVNVSGGGVTASISGPSSLRRGNSGTLVCSFSAATSWQLTSSLGNWISPSFGTGSTTVSSTYTANTTGTDTVTLQATGDCGTGTGTLSILVSDAPPPPPPPPMGLKCCDGTRSPTCFSCANKQGCCSGHKGVCDCGSN